MESYIYITLGVKHLNNLLKKGENRESLFCALEWVLLIYFRPHFCIWFHLHAIFLSQSLIKSVTWNTLTVFV